MLPPTPTLSTCLLWKELGGTGLTHPRAYIVGTWAGGLGGDRGRGCHQDANHLFCFFGSPPVPTPVQKSWPAASKRSPVLTGSCCLSQGPLLPKQAYL